MFQNYMRSRLGLSSPTAEQTPQGFNGGQFHPEVNPQGWQGHPANPATSITQFQPKPMDGQVESPGQFSPSPSGVVGGSPAQGGQSRQFGAYSPYSW